MRGVSGEWASVGWDVGGAHLKVAAADAGGRIVHVRQLACPLWRGVNVLREALQSLAAECAAAAHAVTMTGELSDVFASRDDGVHGILEVLAAALGDRRIHVYGGPAGWLSPGDAAARSEWVASMNWHVTAAAIARAGDSALLLDIGSTTMDLVPVREGAVLARGHNDADRLACDELLYQGVVRTPVMAVCRQAPYAGRWQHLAAEYFANMADVYRLTGELGADADLMDTADGRSKDRRASAARLARMLGRDGATEPPAALDAFARFVAYCQFDRLQRCFTAAQAAVSPPGSLARIVGAGCGRFLARRLAAFNGLGYADIASVIPCDGRIADKLADCAPAAALARLAWLDRV